MLVKLAALLSVVGTSSVQAQSYNWKCDRYTRPNYDSSKQSPSGTRLSTDHTLGDRIVADVDWNESPFKSGTPIPDDLCAIFIDPIYMEGQDANCIIAVCNTRGDGQDTYLNVVSGPTFCGIIK